jgi:peptidoglycan/xylan/chitin deacetylase (PgdA/CDA1 family)
LGACGAPAAAGRYLDAVPRPDLPSCARSRTRAPLALPVLAGVLLVLLAGCGGSSSPSRSVAAAGAPAGVAHTEGAGTDVPVAQGSARATTGATPESSAVRSLIALGRPIYCAAPHGDEVALTFDDGPGPYTQLVMKKLRLHGANATFFDVGRNIDLVAGATRRERALGAIGDHTFTHPLLTSLAPAEAESEIARTQTALERSSGGPVFLFRPPYGAHDPAIDSIVQAHGMLEILWTIDSADSLGANYAQIERNVIAGLRGGSIILMHENHGQTVRALPNIFGAIRSRHLRAVSVAQLLTDDTPSVAQVRGGGAACGIHGRAALSGG